MRGLPLPPGRRQASHMPRQNYRGERYMRARSWAIVGSLVINLMLGLAIAAVFSGSPTAAAADLARCPAQTATHSAPAPAQPARSGHRYIVAVRMGWAM